MDSFTHSDRYVIESEKIVPFIDRFLPLADMKGKAVFDAGCRLGEFAAVLDRHGAAVTGVDLNADCIAQARRLAPSLADRLFVRDIRDLSGFEGGQYDYVICLGVMCYLKPAEWASTLAGLCRLCKDDGKVLVLFQKPAPLPVKGIVALINALPSRFYLNVICPVAARIGSWMSRPLLGHKISPQAFHYRVLVSLKGLHFGYPPALAPFETPLPETAYASSARTAAFFGSARAMKAALEAPR